MRQLKIGLVVVLAVLGVIFAAQNTEVVEVRFLFWELGMSMIVLLSGLLLVGAVAGAVLATLFLRPRDRSRRSDPGSGSPPAPPRDPAQGR